jgi:hypothetical protein
MWQNLIAVAIIAASVWLIQHSKKKKIKSIPDNVGEGGFVTVIFDDGSTRNLTLVEIEQKVKKLNGELWLVERKYSFWIGGLVFLLGIAVELAVILFWKVG